MDSRVTFTVDAYPSIRHDAQLESIGKAPLREGRFVSYRALATVTNPVGQLLPGMSASVELTRADSRQVMRIPARALIFRPRNYLPPMSPEELERQKRASGGDMSLVRAGADGAEFGRLLRQGKRLVFSLRNGELVRHEIRIGAETDEFVEVTEGLRGGEMIVVSHRPPADLR
jgi:HlyD family secretion protein